ncbi:MAG: hypothetical protein Q4C61_14445 [Lachnospiraceae bacterium]|nr:hypothetical protein [Lachnospiraceae bacterium]
MKGNDMLFRILTLREHKTVTFCEAYSYELYRQQLMIFNELLGDKHLVVGAVIDAEWCFDVNRSGVRVVSVNKIRDVFTPEKSLTYKSYHFTGKDVMLDDSFANELNGGIHLLRWKFYIDLITFIRNDLLDAGIVQLSTPILTKYRGTSIANPANVTGEYIGKRYIKITHELELKKRVYMSLVPVFELGYVVRDRYVTKTGRSEFLTLESVLPINFSFELKDFYQRILTKAISLAKEYSLEYNHGFDDVAVVDVLSEYRKSTNTVSRERLLCFFDKLSEKYNHVIFINAPFDSPLGLMSEWGVPLETQWNLNGHGIGHGYSDEYRTDYLVREFYRQQLVLREKGIDAELPEDYIRYCEYGSIPTYSFNLGIERFVEFFFNS